MSSPQRDVPPEVFEALVQGWAEILIADYLKRHPEHSEIQPDAGSSIMPGDSLDTSEAH